MASSLYNLALDFSKELNYTKAIMARQGDKGITVTVKPYLNGLQMDTSGGTFTLKGTTPSNRYVDSVATSVTSEEVTFSLDGTFMSEAGYYKHCYVEYRKDNQILTTQDIIFFSLGVSDISQGQADEYVSQLEELIRKYNETFDAFMAETKGRVDSLNQQITDLTGQAKTLQDKLDALKEEISKLGNLQVMYSNSIDFGNYDYSGNPNLLSKLSYDLIENQNTSAGTLSKGENSFKYNKISAETEGGVELYYKRRGIANWLPSNKTLVMTVKLRAGVDYSPADGKKILIRYRFVDNGTGKIVLDLPINSNSITQEWKEFSITGTTPTFGPQAYHPWIQFRAQDGILGEIEMSYDIKIEEGSTATPYQPNLLDAPHYLSKTPLGENIANKSVTFPINTSAYKLYEYNTEEDLIIGQTYTITLKGTKPASQTFAVYNYWNINLGSLKPVEGLTDVWSITFTPTTLEPGLSKDLIILQSPKETAGSCQIEWLKLEKGDTRTPNISQFKYFGEGLKDSNDPNDYSWDFTPEYTEKALTNTLNLTDPQTALGIKNFKDGARIDGVDVATVKNLGSVLQSGSGLTTIQSDKQSAFDEFSYEFERIGDRVFFHARVKTNSTTAVASHVNLLEIPLGFQFPVEWTIVGIPLSVVQWTTPQGEISALVITDLTGKQVVKFATNRVGNHYISGEWRTADSYPETK
ncbi:BppU family phage baseplate upper protein [Enterococcus faecium]|uniref:BppU family phage baseplate upper protein n=2 Tax=Enterococcus faecium TaxID=1352 RepID=UPI00227183F7|nr:BppU family phage baseplate upper protein [Enterococcus faecium]